MSTNALTLTGPKKVAALLIALGTEASAKLLSRLPQDGVDRIALELMRMPALEADVRDAILEETYTGVFSQLGALPGGESYALSLFKEAFGEGKAVELISRVQQAQIVAPFDFLKAADPAQVKELLTGEHPQTIALVLAHLEPRQAAKVLVELEPELQVEVARRIALTEPTTPDTLVVVEEGIRRRITAVVADATQVGGARPLAHVLNQVGRSTERQILGSLAESDAELADEVRRFMFVFEDVALIDDRSMQRIIREIDTKDIALALRTAAEEVKKRFFGNMSQRAAEMLREEMSLTTQVRIKNVEEAQGRIVEAIKRLEDADEIVISAAAIPLKKTIIRQARSGGARNGQSPMVTSHPDSRHQGAGQPAGTVIRGRRSGLTPTAGTAPGSAAAGLAPAPGRPGADSPALDRHRRAVAAGIPTSRAGAASASLHVDLRELHQRVEDRGYAIGRGRAEAEFADAIKAAGAMAARIEAMAPRETSAVAHALVAMSTAIARRIVGAELQLDPTILVRALEAAVAGINGSPEARVLLHPDQLEPVQVAWETAHGNAYLGKHWTFEGDASLPPGGCVLRYEHGVVSAGLEAQVDEIAAAMDEALPGLRRVRQAESRPVP